MLLKLAWRNLWRNKLRTAIVLGAMIFGLMSVSIMIGFMNGMLDNMTQNAINWQTSHLKIHQQGYQADPDINKMLIDETGLAQYLTNNAQVKTWTSRHLAEGMIASARSTRAITINGVHAQQEASIRPIKQAIKTGYWLDDKGRNPIVVSQKTADRLRLRIGSKVVITFSDYQGDVSGAAFRVRGIYKSVLAPFDETNVFVRKTDLQQLSGLTTNHELAILVNDLHQIENIKQLISDTFNQKDHPINEVQSWDQLQPLLATMSSTMAVSNLIMLIIFVLAMGFAIVNILLMSLFERTREFGVLMAVGMQKHKILALISLESTLLGLVGATLGLICSLILIAILTKTGINLEMVSEGLNSFGLDTLLFPHLAPKDYATIYITIVTTSFLAGLYPAWQILKQKPVDAMAEKH